MLLRVRFYVIMNQENNSNKNILKSLREAKGLTQPQLSFRMGCGIRSISDWENGHKIPRFDNALALARELGVSLKDLAIAMDLDVSGISDDIHSKKKSVDEPTVSLKQKS